MTDITQQEVDSHKFTENLADSVREMARNAYITGALPKDYDTWDMVKVIGQCTESLHEKLVQALIDKKLSNSHIAWYMLCGISNFDSELQNWLADKVLSKALYATEGDQGHVYTSLIRISQCAQNLHKWLLDCLLDGKLAGHSDQKMCSIVRLPENKQRAALEALMVNMAVAA